MVSKISASTGVANLLAEHVLHLESTDLSPHTRDIVLCCLLDLLGAAAAALRHPGVAAARAVAPSLYGAGDCPIWFSGTTANTCAALLANSNAAAALDLDDGYRPARGHPGAAVIPAALAMLSWPGVTAEQLMLAIVAGYEAGVRMSMGRHAYAPSGAWSPYAVIATIGRLQSCDAHAMAQAFGIAAQTAPALPALAGMAGSDVKEGIAAGVVAGYTALQLAAAGFTGPAPVLDDPALFAGARIVDGLGDRPLIEGTYFKPYGCCRHIHGALDAFALLQREHALRPEDIDVIEVHTYRATFNLANRARPNDLVDAQYSVPHCLAVLACHGSTALLPLHRQHLADAAVHAMAQRVSVHHDASIEPLFPQRSPSWVRVRLRQGEPLCSPLTDPRGDPADPLDWAQLREKFLTASAATLDHQHQLAVITGVEALREGHLQPLREALGRAARLD
ncbi:MAG TPA: MmgE/PrpD family protein [Herbaspirillum sp.]|uniref:MmgE/PrpD family protein n=1 Tax=Herbaspirillum sp. TaxID=1890675 RepID=UPI002D7098C5|nr:MmgE/PrpD family protein [Herbaspirillum sp.]HZG18434.1 MmgE/PrpD family protein [Herbaspirillum sp.]